MLGNPMKKLLWKFFFFLFLSKIGGFLYLPPSHHFVCMPHGHYEAFCSTGRDEGGSLHQKRTVNDNPFCCE